MKTILTTLKSKYIHSSLSLFDIRAFCKDAFPDIEIVEFSINDQYERICSELISRKPDLLGFSCYIWNVRQSLDIIGTVRTVLPECRIVLGGPEVSYDGADLMEKYPFIDYIAVGEGEETFYELLDCLHGNGDIGTIKGLIRRHGGDIAYNGDRPPIALDSVPFAYESGFDNLENRIVYYETSRGCPYRCQYCLSSTTGPVRFLSMERVKRDLLFFIRSGVKQVKLIDRTFNCSPARAREILSFIIDSGGTTNFHFEVAGDIIDDETLAVLSRAPAGLFQLEIGIQSVNHATLEAVKRKTDLNKLFHNVATIIAADNIHVHLDLIAGLPQEDYSTMAASFNSVLALKPHRLQLGFLKLLKGSGLRASADQFGCRYTAYPPYEILFNDYLSYEELQHLKRIEELTELYYNSHRFDGTIEYLIRLYNGDAFGFFDDFGQYWQENGYFSCSHSNIRLYEIMLGFGMNLGSADRELFRELLLFDYIRHEKPVKYPSGLANDHDDKTVDSIHRFLRDEDNIRNYVPYLIGYPPKQSLRIIHIEVFNHRLDLQGDERYLPGRTAVLFDYRLRSGVLQKAAVKRIEI